MSWLYAFPALYVIKKIYDIATEDSSSSDTYNYSKRISAQKGKRTKRRKDLLKDLININCQKNRLKVSDIINRQSSDLGKINIDQLESGTLDISFQELDDTLHHLNTTFNMTDHNSLFLDNAQTIDCKPIVFNKNKQNTSQDKILTKSFFNINCAPEVLNIMASESTKSKGATKTRQVDRFIFDSTNLDLDQIVKKADIKYGEMSGISAVDEYIEDDDPFVRDLKNQYMELLLDTLEQKDE
jgi:hypothetical protein